MVSGRSYKLGTLFGIRLGVNASWFLILFLLIVLFHAPVRDTIAGGETAAYLMTLGLPAVFFGSIVLHEVGHALMARREGIGVSGIDLFFFGGLMKMDQDTPHPGAEFRVAAAGPAVTAVLIAIAWAAGSAIGPGGFPVFELRAGAQTPPLELLLGWGATINVLLLGFNLIPAYPLDGGRLLRAGAWRLTGDRERATRFAARIGQGFAYLLIALGIALAFTGRAFQGVWLVVLGWLMAQTARGAVMQSGFSEKLRGVTVADIMDAEPVAIPADLPARDAFETYFLRYGWEWFAVVEGDGRLVGAAYRDPVERAVEHEGGSMPARELVARDTAQEGRVDAEASLEALLGSEPLRRLGWLMAVDERGRLRGVVTFDQVTRALQTRLA
jgi:Zn-dependent protease/CBS domain-containing protein